MNLFDRFILTIYSLSLIVISAVAICVFAKLIDYRFVESAVKTIYASDGWNIPYLIVALIFFLISIRFFLSAFIRRRSPEDKAIYQRNDLGHVSISLETIRAIAERAARKVRGVRGLKTEVRSNEQGNLIKLKVSVDGETPLPEMTQKLQYDVKELVENVAGIDVAEVSVIVTEVATQDNLGPKVRRVE